MKSIIGTAPETPAPQQLDLFDFGTKTTSLVHSADDVESCQANEIMIRSPTLHPAPADETGKREKFELNEAQKSFASSLLIKSRELVKRSREIKVTACENQEHTTNQ